MGARTLIFISLFSFVCANYFSQDYFSYGGGNYSGMQQIISNPAAAADNRLKFDMILAGADVTFNNSWFGIRREAVKNYGTWLEPQFSTTWKNTTPNVPDNIFKNFIPVKSQGDKSIALEGRILLPSIMFQINQKNTIAFTWSVRQMANISGISQQLAGLFEQELNLNVTQNNHIQNQNLAAIQMTWAEYGLTYGRVLKDKREHFLKAGITPKLLQGLESSYLVVKNMDVYLSTKDTSSYFKSNFSYGHSANVKSPFPVNDFYHYVTKPTLGLDLGFIYEWRPNWQKFKYREDGKHYVWRRDLNKYKLKFGASIVDLGKVRFQKEGTYYDLDVSVNKDNFTQFTTVGNTAMFDSLLRAKFSSGKGTKDFTVMLPTALNTQLDYSINRLLYLNLSSHLGNFYKSDFYRVYNYSAICFAPRYENFNFDISVPFTYNTLSAKRGEYIMTGLNIRLGALNFGSNDFIPLFKGNVHGFNFYAMLRAPIPYKQIHDMDGDGVIDKKDACPDIAGDPALNGCPDADHDLIPDKDDACPHQPGLIKFRGCPDTDGDGIKDGDDLCPTEKGSLAMRGCPDADGDSIPDKEDACPDKAGSKQFKGCPDSDHDGIIDKEDLCPTLKGLAKYKGCPDRDKDQIHDGIDQCPDVAGPAANKGCPWPDTDKDGILDKVDSCITIPGVPAFKGCPAPIQLALVEKRIIEKAYSSLEFATGKDLIKPISFPSLNALAKLLVTHKEDWQLKLSGHTDNEGTQESNLILSEKRAKAVQNYLNKRGVPLENIKTEWFGQSQPIADNATKAGKQKNRRVEMKVIQKVD